MLIRRRVIAHLASAARASSYSQKVAGMARRQPWSPTPSWNGCVARTQRTRWRSHF